MMLTMTVIVTARYPIKLPRERETYIFSQECQTNNYLRNGNRT